MKQSKCTHRKCSEDKDEKCKDAWINFDKQSEV
jgi:hypothetical protein